MKEFLIVLLCYLNCVYAGSNNGNCVTDIPNFSNTWLSPLIIYLEDNLTPSESVYTFTFSSDVKVEGTLGNWTYVSVDLSDEKVVTFATTVQFQNIQEDYYNTKTGYEFTVLQGVEYPYAIDTLSFICDGSTKSTLDIRYYIRDNNDPPVLSSTTLEYKVPMPVMPQVDLSIYTRYTVVDYDFLITNKAFAFSSESNTFSVDGIKIDDWESIISIRSNSFITNEKSFTLTVTDSHSAPNTVKATVTVTNDETQSLDIPKFMKSYYEFNLDVDNDKLEEVDGPITIESNKDSSDYKLSGDDNSKIFDVLKEDDKFVLSIIPNADLSVLEDDVRLTLTYTSDVSTTTTIIIYLLKDDNQIKFSSAYYTGNYTSENKINMIEDIILLTASNSAEDIKLSFDTYNENFEASFDSVTGICTITVNNPLTTKDSILTTTLNALISDQTVASTAIILYLPIEDEISIKFSSSYYTGNYTSENKINMIEDIILLTASNSAEDIKLSFDTYNENFVASFDSATGICTITVNNPLTTKDSILTTTLNALISDQTVASTAIILYLPIEDEISIKFSSSYYTGNYTSENKINMIEDIILLTASNSAEDIKLSFDTYNENFEASFDSATGICTITVNNPLTTKDSILTTTLNALISDQTVASTAIILYLPIEDEISIKFSSSYYKGNYTSENKINMIEDIILLTASNSAEDIKLSFDTYNENFVASFDSATGICTITVNNPLTTKDSILTTTLNALISDQTVASTAIILYLPIEDEISIKFSSSYYQGNYTSENKINMIEDIILLTASNSAEDIKLSFDTYNENFVASFDSATGICTITVNNPLTTKDSILTTTLNALISDQTVASTAIILYLPIEDEISIKFSSSYYQGNYTSENKINMIEDIILLTASNSAEDIKLSFDTYNENFEASFDSVTGICTITVNNPLTTKDSILITTLNALISDQTVASTAIILYLPIEDEISIKFSSSYYTGNYTSENKINMIEDIILLTASNSAEDIKLSFDTYNENFVASFDSATGICTITVNNPLTTKDSILTTTLNALISDQTVASTAIILYLPIEDEISIKFSSSYYTGNYTSENKINMIEDIILLTASNSAEDIKLSFDTYNENFEASFDSATGICTITVNNPLTTKDSILTTTLNALISDQTVASTAIILYLPTEEGISFNSLLYKATYDPTNPTLELESNNDIFINGANQENVNIAFEDYFDYFKPTYDTDSGKWIVNVCRVLPEDLLKSGTLVSKLIASIESSTIGDPQSVIVITLPNLDSEIKFLKSYYTGNYTSDDNVVMNENIILETTIDEEITFQLDSYSQYLSVKRDSETGKCIINVDQNLPNGDDIVLTISLSATILSTSVSASTVIILYLPSEETISFSSSLYKAKYISDQSTLELETDNSIEINGAEQETINIIFADYSENFKATYDSNSGWTINVENVPEDVLKLAQIVTKLTAQDKNNANLAQSAIVVSFPEYDNSTKLLFSKTYYKAKYSESAGVCSVQLDEKITFLNGNPDNVSLNEYGEYFQLENGGSPGWNLNCLGAVPDDLKSGALVIIITATDSSNELTGTALLIISFTQTDPPKFTRSYYQADYVIDENEIAIVALQNAINIENKNQENVKITPTEYTENFEIVYDQVKEEWLVNVRENLNDLSSASVIIAGLEAIEDNQPDQVGEATLVIGLPQVNSTDAPRFSQNHYIAEYALADEGLDSVTLINVDFIYVTNTQSDKAMTVEIDSNDEFKTYFNVKEITTASYTITVTKNLEEDLLKQDQSLVISLAASVENVASYATMVIFLPKTNTNISTIEFNDILYTGSYKINKDNENDLKMDDTINIVTDLTDVEVSLTGDFKNYFTVNYHKDSSLVEIVKGDDIPWENIYSLNYIQLTLLASSTEITAKSVIVLSVENKNDSSSVAPEFSQTYYIGTFEKENVAIQFNEDIKFTNKDDVTDIKLVLENNKFTVEWSGNVIHIKATEQLSNNVITKLTAIEESNANAGVTTLIINVKNQENDSDLIFSNIFYKGNYTESDGVGSVELNENISLMNDEFDDVAITLDAYDSYFNVEKIVENKNWKITINNKLPTEILATMTTLTIKLLAQNSDNLEGESVLIVLLPEFESPKFNQTFYQGYYNSTESLVILKQSIAIDNKIPENITITLDNYNDIFSPKYNDDKQIWTIEVVENISLNSDNILITLQATETSYTEIGLATLVIATHENIEEVLTFSQNFYKATILFNDGEYSIEMEQKISINYLNIENINLQLYGTYSEYFDVKPIPTTNEWSLTYNPIPENVNQTLIFTLKAVQQITEYSGISILIISFENIEAPQFSRSYYEADYNIINNTSLITLKYPIEILNKNTENVNITLTNYNDYLELVYNANLNSWELKVVKDFLDMSEVVNIIGLEAVDVHESDKIGLATLILTMPEINSTDAPKFSQRNYIAAYNLGNNEQNNVTLIDNEYIYILNSQNDKEMIVEISEPYNTNFGIEEVSTNNYRIVVLENLDEDILNTEQSLVITLTASVDGSASYATLVIFLPKTSSDSLISFNDVIYTGFYSQSDNTNENDKITLENSITITTELEGIQVRLAGDYSQYFNHSYSENKVNIEIKQNIPEEVLIKLDYIHLDLLAASGSNSAKAAVILAVQTVGGNSDGTDDDDDSNVALLVSTIILGVLLAGYITATVAYYFIKIRPKSAEFSTDYTEEEKPRFVKNTSSFSSNSKTDSVFQRRPTGGIPFQKLQEDVVSDEITLDQNLKNEETSDYDQIDEVPKKTVVFDEVVKEMEIERVKDDDDVFNQINNDATNDVTNDEDKEIDNNDEDDKKEHTVVEMETIPNKSMFFDEVVKELKVDTFNNQDDNGISINQNEKIENESDS